MVEPLYRTCGIPFGLSHLVFLQNITSTLTTRLLNVEPSNIVLDMVSNLASADEHNSCGEILSNYELFSVPPPAVKPSTLLLC
jgi:hypothetical protein